MSTPVFRRSRSSPAVNYGIAVLSAATAVAGAVAFDRLSGTGPAVSLFLCAIMFVAWASGPGPALLATALTMLAFDWFFLQPIYSFGFHFRDLPRLAVFAIAALFVVALSAAQRRAEESLRSARDEQARTVQELQRLKKNRHAENAEQKRAEERASRAERELQLTIDTIPALASRYRTDGTTDFVNQTWRSYTGLSQESWTGRGSTVVHPDDRPRVEQAWAAHLAAAEPFEVEQRMRRADGEYRWYFVRRVPLRDDSGNVIAWYGAGYDIEARNRAELALRESEARLAEAQRELQLTLDRIPVLAWQTRSDGYAEYLNKRWLDYTGLPPEHALGWEWQVAIHPDDLPGLLDHWRDMLASGNAKEVEARMRR